MFFGHDHYCLTKEFHYTKRIKHSLKGGGVPGYMHDADAEPVSSVAYRPENLNLSGHPETKSEVGHLPQICLMDVEFFVRVTCSTHSGRAST